MADTAGVVGDKGEKAKWMARNNMKRKGKKLTDDADPRPATRHSEPDRPDPSVINTYHHEVRTRAPDPTVGSAVE